MLRIPTPFRDTSLLLSPRWGDWSAFVRVPLLLLAIAVPCCLIVWLYRTELRLVRRKTALTLLALRLCALGLLLGIVLFQPILTRTVREELPGRVLVAVDASASMDIKDPQRPQVDRLQLARQLQLAKDICSDAQLDDWIRQYKDKGSVLWLTAAQEGKDTDAKNQLVEQRRRMHDQALRRADDLTRLQIARKILGKDGLNLVERLAKKHQVELVGFAEEPWEIAPKDVADSSQAIASASGDQESAHRHRTDLRLPLLRALETKGTDDTRIRGVVLLTDGQHNAGEAPIRKALEMGEQKLPILPIALGPKTAPPDVAVSALKAPPTVFMDVDAAVEARFKVTGLPAQELVVELQCPGQPAIEKKFPHRGEDQHYQVRFPVRLSQIGRNRLTVAVRPVTGETTTANNQQTTVVNVANDRAKVLLIDGEARWEYHYLASALQRDRAVQLQSVLFQQPRVGRLSEEELTRLGNPALALPPDPDAFAGYDCIILGDVTPEQLPPAERIRLEKYVADAGGTLVVLAGKRAMPHAFPATDPSQEALHRLLPIEESKPFEPAKGFGFSLTHEGKLASFLQLDDTPEASENRWNLLPNHFWAATGKAKPGAVVLATLGELDTEDRGKAGKEDERALLVRHNYGFGRVLYMGLDSTWRWRYKAGDAYHHRFWGQVIRWAAADKPLVAGTEQVRFGTREPVYRLGQEVDVVVRLGEDVPPLRAEALAGARLLRQLGDGKEEAIALVPLGKLPAQPRVLEGRARDLPAGTYAVELAIPELADKLNDPTGSEGAGKVRAIFTVAAPDSEELVELAANLPLLQELAAKSSGQVFAAEEADQVIDWIDRQPAFREYREESRLWQWWGTLAAVLALLTAEWVIRKLAGLP